MLEKLSYLEKISKQRFIPIIGREKGQWLYEFIKENRPKKILELGTSIGYSGIILGSQGAKIITIDFDKKIQNEAREHFKKFSTNVTLIHGNIEEEVKKFNERFDLIFMDFSKKLYLQVFENCLKLIKDNGFIIVDNILSEDCKEFKDRISKDKNMITEIINIEDGLGVVGKC